MTIIEQDFKLESCGDDSPFWDLSFKKVINKGKENEREDYSTPLYGMSLDNAIRRICHYRVSKKYKDKAITMATYLKDFRKIWEEMREICHENIRGQDKN